jgi:membrane protease YdiL (CAAX protease family)
MTHLERALDNQNQWWKYLVIIAVAFFGGQLIGAIPLFAVIFYKAAGAGKAPALGSADILNLSQYGISPNLGLFLLVLPFIVSLVAMALLLKPLHKRSLTETINGANSIRWGRVLFGAAVWGALLAIYLFIAYSMNPGNFQFRFDVSSFIPLVLISIVFIPFQAGFEEVLFRGYLAQGFAAWTKSRWAVIIIPGLLFALMHGGNPEVEEFGFWTAMPQYVLLGLVLGLISTLDDGIETAIGAHVANNVFASVFVTYKSSALQTPALFNQLHVDPVKETKALMLASVIFVAILAFKYKWRFSTLNTKVQRSDRPDEFTIGAPLTGQTAR